jgi:two-component SAPR family response regulator
MWGPRHLAALYARALDARIEVEHVKGMIRRLALVPPDPDKAPESWPWPVRIHTLGRFEIHIDGRPVKFSGKVQRKPLELLKLLIALGGQAVPETRLSEILWPDADGDDAHRDFSTTLHRLRRLLLRDQVLPLEYGCLSVNRELVWLDVTVFAANAQPFGETADAFGSVALQRAVALYRGEFLPEEYAPWALLPREQARTQFQHAVEHHGRTLEHLGLRAQALGWYRAALNVAPLTEAFHHRLMQCHATLGQRQEAIDAFGHYASLLATQGLPGPGARIVALHEQLSTVSLPGKTPPPI